MSLIFAEGFENYGSSGRPDFYKYSSYTNAINNELSTGRFLGNSWRMGATWVGLAYDQIITHEIAPSGNDTFYMGMAIKKRSTSGMTGGYSRFLLGFLDSNDEVQCSLYFDPANEANATTYKGAAGTQTGTNTFINDTEWHYIQFGAHIDAVNGWHELTLDGVQIVRFDGDTTSTTADDLVKVRIRSPFNYATWAIEIDDIYVCDANGTSNNDFLGEIAVESHTPLSDGTNKVWMPTLDQDNSANVNEEPPNVTNHLASKNIGDTETFNIGSLNYVNTEIRGVMVDCTTRSKSTTNHELRSATKVGSTTFENSTSGNTVLAGETEWKTVGHAFDNNPNTSAAWTAVEVGNSEFGFKLNS